MLKCKPLQLIDGNWEHCNCFKMPSVYLEMPLGVEYMPAVIKVLDQSLLFVLKIAE